MKFHRMPVLLTVLVVNGCDAPKAPAPPSQPAAAASVQQPRAAQPAQRGDDHPEAKPAGEAPSTPGRAIYGEVLDATDDLISVLEHDAPTAAELRRATQRFDVAARNWKVYLANGGDSELATLEQSRLAEHAVTSGERLRESILKVARDPAKGDLRPDLQSLLRAIEKAMSVTERAAFQKWITENGLNQ